MLRASTILLIVALGIGLELVTANVASPRTVLGQQPGTRGVVTGRVVASSQAGDGRPLIQLQTPTGTVVAVYVADDADAAPPRVGTGYEIEGAVQGSLFVANVRGGIRQLPSLGTPRSVTAAVVCGYAITDANERIPAPNVPDGDDVVGTIQYTDAGPVFVTNQ